MRESIALSWETIASKTAADPTMCKLLEVVTDSQMKAGLRTAALPPFGCTETPVCARWCYSVQRRVVIPPALRNIVLQILHAAYQGVSAMESRARAIVFWPGLTDDIRATRDSCFACNQSILVLRDMFATFGVPEDISSDGGP